MLPTKIVLLLATALATSGGVNALKSQVAQELNNRGQQAPAGLVEKAPKEQNSMTIESPEGQPPVVDETEPQKVTPAPPNQNSQMPWLRESQGNRPSDPLRRASLTMKASLLRFRS